MRLTQLRLLVKGEVQKVQTPRKANGNAIRRFLLVTAKRLNRLHCESTYPVLPWSQL